MTDKDIAKKFEVNPFITSLSDEKDTLMKMRDEGLKRGSWTGFDNLSELYSVKRGSTTYLIAQPHCGKSVFVNELIVNLIEFSGYKVVIFSPETGSAKDIFNELLWAYLKKPFIKNKKGINASDSEVQKAFSVLQDNVRVLDFGITSVTIDMLYLQVHKLQEDGFDADMIVIDPLTEITNDSSARREDLAFGDMLTKIRRYSSKYDIHSFVCMHTSTLETVSAKDAWGNQIRYNAIPTMFNIAGGNMASRKGMSILSLWRCPYGLPIKGTDGYYEENQTMISVLKSKPKITGKLGECILNYDYIANRFFETDQSGNKIFAHSCPSGNEEREVSPNYVLDNYSQTELEL